MVQAGQESVFLQLRLQHRTQLLCDKLEERALFERKKILTALSFEKLLF
jgi:hypothetical protein